MAVIRPSRLIGVAQGASPTSIAKCVAFSWTTKASVRTSKNDGDIGITMAAVTGWEYSGTLYFLNHQDCANLQQLGVVRLVVSYKVAGGTTKTRTFGTTADASGVKFGRFVELNYSPGGEVGNQPRIAVPWRGIIKDTYTLPSDFMTVA